MQITNSFRVPLPADRAWVVLMDVERIAKCLPGAKLTGIVDDKTYEGEVSLRLGPMSFVFRGKAFFEDRDDAARTATIKAAGSDYKGRGRAQATTKLSLRSDGQGAQVDVVSDLTLTGALTQFERGGGIISDVAAKIFDEFERRLIQELGGNDGGAPIEQKDSINLLMIIGMATARLWRRLVGRAAG